MMRPSTLLLAATAAALLAGCVSNGQKTVDGRPIDENSAANANMKLGIAYMQQNKLALAKEKLERAEKQDPKNYEVYWGLASLAERLNNSADAERYYQTAMRLAPGKPEVTNTYAVFLCRNGHVDRAMPLYDKVIADPLYPTPWAAATNAAVCLRSEKRHGDAMPYLQKALSLRPDFIPAVVELADVQISTGKPAEARATADRFLGIGRKSPDVLLVAARAAVAEGNCGATEIYSRLLRRDYPSSTQTSSLAQVLASCGRTATP
ncbi:MAG: type IV pilus biogenesis/stability protein PilW [Steroidobacteraceae bacterium]